MNCRSLIVFSLLIVTGPLLAEVPKYSNEFLSIGVGARSFGMGGAIVATGGDVTSGYWNPAGLTGIPKKVEAGLMHAEYFAGIAKYDYAGFAFRSNATLGK